MAFIAGIYCGWPWLTMIFGTSNIEHRTSNIEHRTSNIEHRTSNIEHRTSNIEHRISNIEHRTSKIEHRTSNIEHRTRTKKTNGPQDQGLPDCPKMRNWNIRKQKGEEISVIRYFG